MVMQKHAKTRSKCHFEAIWGPAGQMERRRTSFVYHAWASTTCIEAFVLLVAALAPFTSFGVLPLFPPEKREKTGFIEKGAGSLPASLSLGLVSPPIQD